MTGGTPPEADGGPVRLVAFTDGIVRGGAEQTLGTLLATLSERYEVTVVGVDETVVDWVAARRPGAETRLVRPVRNKADLVRFVDLVRVFRSARPDIIQVTLPTPWAAQLAIGAGLLVRGASVVAVENSLLESRSRLQRAVKRVLSRRLAAHVAVGDWLAREVEDRCGLPTGSIETIHNGIPTELPAQRDRITKAPVVGAVARLSPEKGLDVLVRALPLVPHAQAVIVGAGREQASLEALGRELGVGDRVTFTGWVDDPQAWFGSFDVFALPSRIEGFPLTVLEAMLAGRAVVATDVGGVTESVVDGETGIVVPPEDPEALAAGLRELLEDLERRSQLGRNGRDRVLACFTAPVMAASYEDLYERALERPR